MQGRGDWEKEWEKEQTRLKREVQWWGLGGKVGTIVIAFISFLAIAGLLWIAAVSDPNFPVDLGHTSAKVAGILLTLLFASFLTGVYWLTLGGFWWED